MNGTDSEADDVPEFEDVYPNLDVAGKLLTALAHDDDEAIDELRDSADAGWWNVAWTLALLVRGVRAGEPAAVALVDSLMGNEPDSSGLSPRIGDNLRLRQRSRMTPERRASGLLVLEQVERPAGEEIVDGAHRADVVNVLAAIEDVEAMLVQSDLRPLPLPPFFEPLNPERLAGGAEILHEHVERVLRGVVVHVAERICRAKDRVGHALQANAQPYGRSPARAFRNGPPTIRT
jgi:hypothetical protein